MPVADAVVMALWMALAMAWEILWPLILGLPYPPSCKLSCRTRR
jgi:hypothetical protein